MQDINILVCIIYIIISIQINRVGLTTGDLGQQGIMTGSQSQENIFNTHISVDSPSVVQKTKKEGKQCSGGLFSRFKRKKGGRRGGGVQRKGKREKVSVKQQKLDLGMKKTGHSLPPPSACPTLPVSSQNTCRQYYSIAYTCTHVCSIKCTVYTCTCTCMYTVYTCRSILYMSYSVLYMYI